MRKILISVVGIFVVCLAFATGENIPTSKSYVDAVVTEKQDKISANDGATQVLTNTGTAGEYGTKGIYNSANAYASQSDSLIDAVTMNTAVQNAIDSEFQCVEWADPNDHTSDCLLMDVFGIVPAQTILPNGYTALEYLQSTVSQYIDTGVWIQRDKNAKVEMSVQFLSTNATWFGANAFLQLYSTSSYYSTNSSRLPDVSISPGNRDEITLNWNSNEQNLNAYVNGIFIQNVNWSSLPADRTRSKFYIFALGNYDGSVLTAGRPYGKIYNLKIFIDNNLVRNMIPARRDSDEKLGMYDTVGNIFYMNNGTGTFRAGPDAKVYIPTGN